ncbi:MULTISPECIES: ATP-binding protein [unclassified Streptomyces]|uniref:ATP-binding protein n=1 Tax=unclassified Streptomyces TaxID=2593676 RepID=UPI002E2D3647|nr:LuxR C-terminal-related transcriptional regulator [Streptomyces sp. NBC_00223]
MTTELRPPPNPAVTAEAGASPAGRREAALIGRELELIAVQGRLQDATARLITLTGAAGVGKSSLAHAAVRTSGGLFGHRVAVLDVPAYAAPAELLDRLDRAVAGLGGPGRALLVLDGVEAAIGVMATRVAELLDQEGRLTVLATGQQALGVYGEHLLPVLPLAVPGRLTEPDVVEVQENPAVKLFVQRARRANPHFCLTAENLDAVIDVCNALEGVPLVLELVATRLRLFPLNELPSWLERGGDSHILGPVDAPLRQRSLHDMAMWSCRGLDPGQLQLLRQLAVFEGGMTLAAAERVSPLPPRATSEAIEALLDRHILQLDEQAHGDSRLAMPRTIRCHALQQLEEEAAQEIRDVHARYFQKLMHTVEGRFTGSEQQRWLQVAAAEHDNIRAALGHLERTGDRLEHAALLAACLRPWLIRGCVEDALREFDAAAEELRGWDGETAVRLRARLCDGAGRFAAARGDHDGASHRHRRAVALFKQLRDAQAGARASARMGLALFRCGDRAVGQSLLGAARTTLESLGDTTGTAGAGVALAEALHDGGQAQHAGELLSRAIRIYRQNGETRDLASALVLQAGLHLHSDDQAAARAALRESLGLYDAIGERTDLPAAVEAFALVIHDTAGQPQRAARLLAGADALRRQCGSKGPDALWHRVREAVYGLRRQLGWTVFAAAWQEGARLWPAALVAEALAALEPANAQGGARPEASVLTPRQLQVALLVAEGMTNRQVATQLCIAEWTVVNHVRHIMRKLGCHSRIQVAWAVGRRE